MSFSVRVRLEGDLDEREQGVSNLIDWATAQDVLFLSKRPGFPSLYQSGVRYYTPECTADSCEDLPWESPDFIMARGYSDCKSLSAWRIAELLVRHRFHAKKEVSRIILATGDVLFHVAVRDQAGRIEDPSRILGMR